MTNSPRPSQEPVSTQSAQSKNAEVVPTAGMVLWLTGLSGAGKTTIGSGTADALRSLGHVVVTLDGDVLRRSLNADLGFSPEARHENVRRIGAIATHLARQGIVAIASVIAP